MAHGELRMRADRTGGRLTRPSRPGPVVHHAEVLIVVPVVCPLVLTTGFGAGVGAGGGDAFATSLAFSEGRSMTCFASAWRGGGGADTLLDETALTAMKYPNSCA